MKPRLSLLTVALGLWLISSSLTFEKVCNPFSISDIGSGLLLLLLGGLSLSPKRGWPIWAVGLVGVWLQMAPLVFWARSPWMYINDTLVGVIAIIFSFLFAKTEQDVTVRRIPTGWSYNPSGWSHRIPTVTLAILCWFFARYMAAFQLGYIDQIWDPFFKGGTLHVITSQISKDFPVSDAGLGALCYTLESILGWQGGTQRWRAMPWLVLAFAFLVIPVGVVSVTLIILQPVVVGAWCSWCLGTAASMLIMIVLTAGELAAVLQFLSEAKARGDRVWQVVWQGEYFGKKTGRDPPSVKEKGICGVTFPWNLVVSIAVGSWLMASPSLLQITGALAMSNFILGPMILAFSVIALSEVFRAVRFVNIPLGLGLILVPCFLSSSPLVAIGNNSVSGLLVIALAWRKGKISQCYGAWENFIF